MKEFIEKLIGRLEELKESGNPYDSYWDEAMYRATELVNSTSNKTIDDAIEIVNQLAEEYKGVYCDWTPHDREIDVYFTQCGQAHIFCDGNPEENSHKFCPYCGKKIKVVEPYKGE